MRSHVNCPKALRAINDLKVTENKVRDIQILQPQRHLASLEGIFVDPASAASIAGLKKLRASGKVDPSETVICVTTGHGLKDPSVLERLPKSLAGYNLEITDRHGLDALERIF